MPHGPFMCFLMHVPKRENGAVFNFSSAANDFKLSKLICMITNSIGEPPVQPTLHHGLTFHLGHVGKCAGVIYCFNLYFSND